MINKGTGLLKKLIFGLLITGGLFACNNKTVKGKFTLDGEIKNATDQKIYLEQLYFSEQAPETLDTAEIKNGKFSLTAISPEEGLFRIRLEKNEGGYFFINDADKITFKADVNNPDLAAPTFNTKANAILKSFLLALKDQREIAEASNARIENLRTNKTNDSTIAAEAARQNVLRGNYNDFIYKFIDTTSDPVVAMFAVGYTQGMEPEQIKKVMPGLEKRFPEHEALKALTARVNTMLGQTEAQQQMPAKAGAAIGNMAPEITMPEENGKPFSLSSLRGKYVLVDFWASWCAPCRAENPNVVAAFNKYRNKNFTILGVSLDESKDAWQKAIKDDKLDWKQISDLKGWGSAAVPLYGFDGIPYNVLIDPQGKIIATQLRDQDLHTKLEEVLK